MRIGFLLAGFSPQDGLAARSALAEPGGGGAAFNRPLKDLRFNVPAWDWTGVRPAALALVAADEGAEVARIDVTRGSGEGLLPMTPSRFQGAIEVRLLDESGAAHGSLRWPALRVTESRSIAAGLGRRSDGSLCAWFSDRDETLGVSRDAVRQVVDNGYDLDGDGLRDTAARIDFRDGWSLFDVDGDGYAGGPDDDYPFPGDAGGDGEATAGRLLIYDPALTGAPAGLSDAPADVPAPVARGVTASIEPRALRGGAGQAGEVLVRALPAAGACLVGARYDLALTGGAFVETGTARAAGAFYQPGARAVSDGSLVSVAPFRVTFEARHAAGATVLRAEAFVAVGCGEPISARAEAERANGGAPEIARILTTSGRPSAAPGERVIIEGRFPGGGAMVAFGGVPAVVEGFSADRIETRAPSGAVTGPITVEIGGDVASFADLFETLPAVVGVTPGDGEQGVNPRAAVAVVFAGPAPADFTADDVAIERTEGGGAVRSAAAADIAVTIARGGAPEQVFCIPDRPLAENASYVVTLRRWGVRRGFRTGAAVAAAPLGVATLAPPSGSTLDDTRPEIVIDFDRPLLPASVRDDAVLLSGPDGEARGTASWRPDAPARLSWRVRETVLPGAAAEAIPGLAGGGPYALLISPALAEAGGTRYAGGVAGVYRASARVTDLQPAATLPGGVVTLLGGPFAAGAGDLAVEIGGQPARVLDRRSCRLVVEAPARIASGPAAVRVR
ncbi:MAG: hypothetical protein HY719_07545, partial [Planctomycetes bacterium]|nr:hypothetical protein [Planctomycetota bacterium]